MKTGILLSTVLLLGTAIAAPTVGNVQAAPSAEDNIVTVSYSLSGAPAIVTVDVRTNGASIGGEHIWTLSTNRTINCRIDADGTYAFTWDAGRDWDADAIGTIPVDIVVTAWATNSPPPVMVLDLMANSASPVKYYESMEFLPGGLISNAVYRTTKLVMKKCEVKGRTYTLGTSGYNNRKECQVTFGNDFYLGVFEFTQGQWATVAGRRKPSNSFTVQDWEMRPCTHACWTAIREASHGQEDVAYTNLTYRYPNDPNPNSLLGIIKTRTGMKVDLPSENQWEVAARPGNTAYGWYGVAIQSNTEDPNFPERYRYNGGQRVGFDATGGTNTYTSVSSFVDLCTRHEGAAICGSYKPNQWGFYDMLGNVSEMTIDKWSNPRGSSTGDPVVSSSNSIVIKGTDFNSDAGYGPAMVGTQGYQSKNWRLGFRVMCQDGMR